ncbi:hypothetical protein ADK76_12000 [Streptomyces griseoflavus]|nr:hypothetical protein ADK76_12000 [Streptomyces griseoflavus]
MNTSRGLKTADQLDGDDAVAAEVEEAVVDADLGYAQHLREHLAQRPLHRIARGLADAREHRAVIRLRQRLAVHLAVRGQRQLVQRDERGRHQVVGQPGAQEGTQLLAGRRAGLARYEVGGERGAGRGRQCQYGGLGDLGVGRGGRLDLAQFDAEAAHLHLVVGPAQELQLPALRPAHQVARAVHPRTRTAERVGDEPPRGQPGTPQIAAGEPGPGDVQLPRHAPGYEAERGVQHVHPRAGHRAADGEPPLRRQFGEGGVHRGLGGPVEVEDGQAVALRQPLPQRLPQGLAAEDERAGAVVRAVEQAGVHDVPGEGRGEVEQIDAVGGGVVAQRVRVAARLVVDEVQFVARPHPQQLVPRTVEADGRRQRDPVARVSGTGHQRSEELGLVGVEEVHHAAVLDHHTLGRARGAGGVDDVRGVNRCQGRGAVGVGEVRAVHGREAAYGLRRVEHQVRQTGARQRAGRGGAGQHGDRRGVADQELQALSGLSGVDRQIGGAGLQHREQAHDQVGGARQVQRDGPFGPGAVLGQQPGQPVGAVVQLPEGQPGVRADHRGRVGVPGHRGFEERGQRSGGGAVRGALPGVQQHPAFLGADQVEAAEGRGGPRCGMREYPYEAVEQRAGRGLVVQVGGVLQLAVQTRGGAVRAVRLGEADGEVELGHRVGERVGAHLQPGEAEAGVAGRLPGQHDLEERVPGG